MEQLRQLGEAVGSINALMAFESELRINPRQCRLLADACALALAAVTGEVRAHLRFEDRTGARWRALEPPLRELQRAFRDAEGYVRQCLDPRGNGNWWARAALVAAHCAACAAVEQHLHGILWCLAVTIEAVETAGAADTDADDEIVCKRLVMMLAKKYDADMLEPGLFQYAHGRVYLVSSDLVTRMETAWKEDRWILSQLLDEMKSSAARNPPLTKAERRLADVLAAPRGTVHPASVLLNSDYTVRRHLGGGLKEAQWMGEPVAVKHIVGDGADAEAEVALLASMAHPNVSHAVHCFRDAERKEYVVVMDQLMAKDLGTYVKEACSPRRRGMMPFPLLVAVDVMLQIARGMEYLHGKKVCHGALNPCNVMVKPRTQQHDGYVHVKVAGYGRSGFIVTAKAPANGNANGEGENDCIWYAPEVLDQDGTVKCTEKADVYSFAMICFELLTGKVPFEDKHLQGESTSRNIRAGERPLFPFQAPKYLVSLTKRCWHADTAQRPSFASVCRVLRYVKRFLVMNPADHQQQDNADAPPPTPPVDYLDIEAQLLRRIPAWQLGQDTACVWGVPFQMFAYRTIEREKIAGVTAGRDKASDSGSDGNSVHGEENGVGVVSTDDASSVSSGTVRSRPASSDGKKTPTRKADPKTPGKPGSHQKLKRASAEKPPTTASRRTPSAKPELPARRPTSSHSSD